jgi:hypothetical protein
MDAADKMAKLNALYRIELTPVQRLLIGIIFTIQDFVAESPDEFVGMSSNRI